MTFLFLPSSSSSFCCTYFLLVDAAAAAARLPRTDGEEGYASFSGFFFCRCALPLTLHISFSVSSAFGCAFLLHFLLVLLLCLICRPSSLSSFVRALMNERCWLSFLMLLVCLESDRTKKILSIRVGLVGWLVCMYLRMLIEREARELAKERVMIGSRGSDWTGQYWTGQDRKSIRACAADLLTDCLSFESWVHWLPAMAFLGSVVLYSAARWLNWKWRQDRLTCCKPNEWMD
ncbi:hypothetical protein IWX90DRAFT_166968 [Phyllosticta citrichinensis]|uniref:Uncharacterized protein n=1 Tax=Phyllosticta citrichinensis TaxID=1130410 RepID=A0ABR1Y0V5_9PEZI